MKKIMFSVIAVACMSVAVFASHGSKKSECNPNNPKCTCTHATAKPQGGCAHGCACTK